MSTTFEVSQGDTFATIARKAYGSERYAGLVAQANPGAAEPLQIGAVLTIPPLAGAPADIIGNAPANNLSEVAVLINGRRFRFWEEVAITQTVDAVDSLELLAPFEPDSDEFRATFRPFSYARVVVTVGGDELFTGTMVGVMPQLTDNGRAVSVSCYSTPGVLGDCTPPASAFPVEFNGLPLSEIASALCAPFGIDVVFDGEQGPAFERVAVEPGGSILEFLSGLAKQRSLVVSSNQSGALLFPAPAETGRPVAVLTEGQSPLLSITPTFSPQDYYSHITGLEPVLVGTGGSQFTVRNTRLSGVVRPHTFKSSDVQGGDIKTAVNAKAGRMFGNMASYTLAVDTWRDPSGNLWRKNTTIVVSAPGAMIYGPYEFVIRAVKLGRNGDAETAELEIVLPGSFSGEIPEVLPWD